MVVLYYTGLNNYYVHQKMHYILNNITSLPGPLAQLLIDSAHNYQKANLVSLLLDL